MLPHWIVEVLFLLFILQASNWPRFVLTPLYSSLRRERLISSCCFFARQDYWVGLGPPCLCLLDGLITFLDLHWRASQCSIASCQQASSSLYLLHWGGVFLQPPTPLSGALIWCITEKLETAGCPTPTVIMGLLQPLDHSSPPECIVSQQPIHLSSCLSHFQACLGYKKTLDERGGWPEETVLCLD